MTVTEARHKTATTAPTMRTRVERVSPAMARKWIEASEGLSQRTLSRRQVEKLAHAIASGQWQVTHQGLAISPEGAVLDGNHRLHAILLADQTVPMLVARNVDPEIFGVIDTGRARTPAASLQIAGYTNTNVLAAVVRATMIYSGLIGSTGGEWTRRDGAIGTPDLLEWLDGPGRTDAAHRAINRGRRVAGAVARTGATTPLSAAFLLVSLPESESDVTEGTLAEFVERLADGVMLPSGSPILALRRWLASDTGYLHTGNNARDRRILTMANTVKAINDYTLGVERSLTHFRYGIERLPAPVRRGEIQRRLIEEEERLAAREAAEA